MHKILESYCSGKCGRQQALNTYLSDFRYEVNGDPPSEKIYHKYFRQGLSYLSSLPEISETVLGVERYVKFKIGDYPFHGYIDLITKDDDGHIRITDHKSKDLKTRSKRYESGKGKTETDRTLDSYLRQLYLYGEAIKSSFHSPPSFLTFNCFRTGTVITEPYNEEAAEEAKTWAIETVEKINSERDWRPNINPFTCRYICGVHNECEYYQLSGGKTI